MPGSSPITTRWPAGAASSRSRRLSAKTLIATRFGLFAQAREQVALQAQAELDLPGPGDASCGSGRRRRAWRGSSPGGARCGLRPATRPSRPWPPGTASSSSTSFASSHSSVRPRNTASARCDGHAADRLGVVEVVAELGGVGVRAVLAVDQLALEQRLGPQPLAQLADQRGVFGPALGRAGRARRRARRGRRRNRASACDEGGGRLGQRRPASGRRTAGRPAARARLRARSSPWCGACGLYGRYRSSSSCLVGAASIAARSAGVSLPCSSMLLSTAARRSSSSRR